jgi:hypothetical protein
VRPLPAQAAWRHLDARTGTEVLLCAPGLLRGHCTAVEDGVPWSVGYTVEVNPAWRTVRATVTSLTGSTVLELVDGSWRVDGVDRPDLVGCLDVDLESSAATNTLPVHRLELPDGVEVRAPAAYVRADLRVERLEQTYRRTGPTTFAYASPAFGFAATLAYDEAGLVLDYPGIATRLL